MNMQKIRAIGPTVRSGEALKDGRTDEHIRKQYIWIVRMMTIKRGLNLENGWILLGDHFFLSKILWILQWWHMTSMLFGIFAPLCEYVQNIKVCRGVPIMVRIWPLSTRLFLWTFFQVDIWFRPWQIFEWNSSDEKQGAGGSRGSRLNRCFGVGLTWRDLLRSVIIALISISTS